MVRISDDINVTHLKAACKKQGATVTVGVYSIIGQVIKEYARLNGDEDLS